MHKDLTFKRVLITAALIAIAISLVSILTKSYWTDELWSIKTAQPAIAGMTEMLASDYHPPLYFLFLKGWGGIFSYHEISLRVFQGVQTFFFLVLVFLTGRKSVFQKNGFFPFFLFCLSAELWLFAPMVRYYLLAAITALLATNLFLRWLEHLTGKHTVFLAMSYVLVLYTDYPTAAVILIHGLYLLFARRGHLLQFLKAASVAVLCFLPWALVVLAQIGKLLGAKHAADLNESPGVIILKVLYSLYAFVVNETAYPFDTVIIVALIAAACALFGIQRQRIREQRNQLWFFTLIIFGGIVFTSLLTTFISRHTSFIYTPSRTFFVLPFVYYIIAIVYGAIARPFLRYLFLSALLMAQLFGIGNLAANRHFLMPTYAVPWKTIMADLNGKGGYITADETELYRYYAEQLGGAYPVPINNEGIVDTALVTSTEFPLYTLIFGRESTSVQIDSAGLAFIERNYAARSVIEYLPIDESYRKVKQKFLKRDAYKAKVTLTGYSRRQ